MEWDSELIVDWILNLNQEYQKYEEKLRESLKSGGVTGSLLHHVDKVIFEVGVSLFQDQIAIMQHINRLTTQQQDVAPPAAYQSSQQQFQNDGPDQTAYL